MKNLYNFVLTLVLSLALSLFLPWWSIMLGAFLAGAIVSLKKAAVFVVPFLAISVLWIINAWILANANDFILSKKIAILLPLDGNTTLLLLITGIVGGIAAGIAGVFGNQFKQIMARQQ